MAGFEEDFYTKSARITSDEKKFLDDNKISFTDMVKDSIESRKKKHSILTKKQKVNKVITNGFYVMMGMLFFYMLQGIDNVYAVAIVAGMGILFTVVGSINLYLTMKEDGMFGKG